MQLLLITLAFFYLSEFILKLVPASWKTVPPWSCPVCKAGWFAILAWSFAGEWRWSLEHVLLLLAAAGGAVFLGRVSSYLHARSTPFELGEPVKPL